MSVTAYKPAFFRTPVHCVKVASDGKVYVCDRGNNRIQVFDGRDPALRKMVVIGHSQGGPTVRYAAGNSENVLQYSGIFCAVDIIADRCFYIPAIHLQCQAVGIFRILTSDRKIGETFHGDFLGMTRSCDDTDAVHRYGESAVQVIEIGRAHV